MNFKYITYRIDRKCYQVTIRHNKKTYSKTCRTITEALQQREMFLKLLDINIDFEVLSNSKTKVEIPDFSTAYKQYMEYVKKMQQLTPSTIYTYQRTFDILNPYLRKMLITDITKEILQDIIINLQSKQKWQRLYTKRIVGRIKGMYEYQMKTNTTVAEKIKVNPAKNIDLIKTKKMNAQPVFTDKEKQVFLSNVKMRYGNKWYVLFRLYFETGCRKGELLALTFEDIDFENKTISINKSISKGLVDGAVKEYVSTTKTFASNREIPISQKMALMLLQLKNLCNGKDTDYVFKCVLKDKGKYDFLSASRVTYVFADVRSKSNINQRLHIHSIRHYFATKLMLAGVDMKTVMALGGWNKSSTLVEIYTHATADSKQKAMQNAIFS